MAKEDTHNIVLHGLFNSLPISDACQWYGNEWEDDPTTKSGQRLKQCGEPTVGAGMFCDGSKESCEYISVCERHSVTTE